MKYKQSNLAQEQKTKEEAFSRLTPAEHLERAKSTLKVGANDASLTLANKDLEALKGTTLATQATRLSAEYLASEATARRAASIVADKAAKAKMADDAIINRVLRDAMAKTVENSMLDGGYNVDVTADGPDHTTLRFKWIFVSKVFAHDLGKNPEIFTNARNVGFKRIVATDGYDEVWTWKL